MTNDELIKMLQNEDANEISSGHQMTRVMYMSLFIHFKMGLRM